MWQEANPQTLQRPGEQYRLTLSLRAPYSVMAVGSLEMMFRARFAAAGDVRIDGFEHSPPLAGAHTNGGLAPWPFSVTYTVLPKPDAIAHAGMDPRALLALAALIVTALLSFAIVSTRLERFVAKTVDKVGDRVLDPILSPGVLILAFGAIFLLTRR